MRPLAFALAFVLAGCTPPATPIPVAAGVEVASIAVFHRDLVDLGVSLLTGRDCSVVRLDRGESWCRAPEPPPEPPRFCTRTLGLAECFAAPATLPDQPAGLADGPAMTPAQKRRLSGHWP